MTTNIDHAKIRAARKAHQCDWCLETIEVGQPYLRQRNVDGRDVWTWRAHPECSRASGKLDSWELENAVGITFTRGCTCERGQHEEGAGEPCHETPVAPFQWDKEDV